MLRHRIAIGLCAALAACGSSDETSRPDAGMSRGALAVGSAEEVAEKLLYEHELFGHQRYLAHMSLGAVAHADVMRSIERYGSEVAPLVRDEVARRASRSRAIT